MQRGRTDVSVRLNASISALANCFTSERVHYLKRTAGQPEDIIPDSYRREDLPEHRKSLCPPVPRPTRHHSASIWKSRQLKTVPLCRFSSRQLRCCNTTQFDAISHQFSRKKLLVIRRNPLQSTNRPFSTMMSKIHLSVVAAALILVVNDSFSFWGPSVAQRNFLSNGFLKASHNARRNDISIQMSNPYVSSTPSELFNHILSDEEEEEEPEAPPTTTDAPGETSEMSTVKEGIMFPTTLNGSDVRVGIIMARWNSDIIAGLYKVIICSILQILAQLFLPGTMIAFGIALDRKAKLFVMSLSCFCSKR